MSEVFEAKAEDWDVIADSMRHYKNILFSYSHDNITCHVVSINKDFRILRQVVAGGRPHGRAWVGVRGFGSNHFDLNVDLHPEYIVEKLGVSEDTAKGLHELFGELGKRLKV
jgi:hypothetical protein